MATLTGPGAMKDVSLIARVYNSARTKDGSRQFIDVQVDSRDPRGQQANLHLVSTHVKSPDGKSRTNNGAAYFATTKDGSPSQLDKIIAAAGPNKRDIVSQKTGEVIGTDYAVKADLQKQSSGHGLIINTNTVTQSDFQMEDTTMAAQFDTMREIAKAERQARDAAQSEGKEAPQATQPELPESDAEVCEPEAASDEPSLA